MGTAAASNQSIFVMEALEVISEVAMTCSRSVDMGDDRAREG